MGLGLSIFLIAVGAILAFAVDYSVSGLDLSTIGVILMIVGTIGLLATLLVFAPRGRRTIVEDAYVDDDPGVVGRRRVRRSDII